MRARPMAENPSRAGLPREDVKQLVPSEKHVPSANTRDEAHEARVEPGVRKLVYLRPCRSGHAEGDDPQAEVDEVGFPDGFDDVVRAERRELVVPAASPKMGFDTSRRGLTAMERDT